MCVGGNLPLCIEKIWDSKNRDSKRETETETETEKETEKETKR